METNPPIINQLEAGRLIDHTLLRADAARSEILRICQEARECGFASVCVNSGWAAVVAKALAGSGVKTCCVVGFPLGAMLTAAKVAETRDAVAAGAAEIDMVLNIGLVKGGEGEAAGADIAAVAEAAHAGGAILKVILETALLTDGQKVEACRLAQTAGADYVKTSTGFGPGGATAADICLMRQAVGPAMGVKASGGIRTIEDVRTMVAAGATRIGASAGVAILRSLGESEARIRTSDSAY